MQAGHYFIKKSAGIWALYWELVKIILPVAVATQILIETGIVSKISPLLEPVMGLYGLPAELALAWLTGLLVGIFGALVVLFTVVPVSELTIAQMTVFSALILFAHALPIEQRIVQKAGPGFVVTTVLRLIGGMIYAAILYRLFEGFDLYNEKINPAWIPEADTSGWSGFFYTTAESFMWMFIILFALTWLMEFFRPYHPLIAPFERCRFCASG